MHGHSDKWDSKSIQEKFGYRYSEGEIREWAGKIRDLSADAEVTHVVFNNCYRNYAQVNGQQLERELESAARLHDDLQGQPGRTAAADQRGDLMPVDVVGDGFSKRLGDAEPGQLPGPPVVDDQLLAIDSLVALVSRNRIHRALPTV
jgi:hypothetical protein